MKSSIYLILLVLLSLSCHTQSSSKVDSSSNTGTITVAPENLAQVKFDVRGMSCTNCENTISKSVKELPGIAEIKASYQDSFALVKFDKTKTNAEAIKQAIENKGYEVKGFANVTN